MATPADTPIQQRYTAGQCILEVTAQPLALSKWYSQPLTQSLQFQLQLGSATSDDPILLAQGDRETLQAISQYVSQRVQATLVTAALSQHTQRSPTASADRSTSAATTSSADRSTTENLTPVNRVQLQQNTTLPKPQALQITQPLSYVQLCNLHSVLSQCEQTVRTLPVTLPTFGMPALEASADATNTNTESVNQSSPRTADNVIPLQRPRKSPQRTSKQRRIRARLWASSAAAALFAVGLASVLPQSQVYQQSDQQIAATTSEQVGREQAETSVKNNIESEAIVSDAVSPDIVKPDAVAPPIENSGPTASGRANPLEADVQSQLPNVLDNNAAVQPSSNIESPLPGSIQRSASVPAIPKEPSRVVAPAPSPPPVATEAIPEIAVTLSEPSPAEISRAASPSTESLSANGGSVDGDASPIDETTSAETPTFDRFSHSAGASSNIEAFVAVQSYFQRQWQQMGEDRLDVPLRYDLQLSEMGEVVNFVALDERAQAYRDRLLPIDNNGLRFRVGENGQQLRLEILTDGRVVVKRSDSE
ncbi:MAG: hypothetical protein AAF703_01385 [Cyanobacteria bacterium P01_D01_bin.105]